MNRRVYLLKLTLAMFVLLLHSACRLLNMTTIGEMQTETQTVEVGDAEEVSVHIKMPAGALAVTGGAAMLAEATFRYNAVGWNPNVDYRLNGSQGLLSIDQTGDDFPVQGKLVNEWQIALSNALPLDLRVDTGAGEAQLDLRGMDLSALTVQLGAGRTVVDLSSSLNHDLRASIEGGMGELSVRLPAEMGVQVTPATGIGEITSSGLQRDGDNYVNEAFGEAAYTLYLDIGAGIGAIELLAE